MSGIGQDGKFLYIFLDEAGNLDFSNTGTKYFLLTAVTKERPFNAYKELTELKYDLVELGTEIEYFHAAEDRQAVRNQVFEIIQRNLTGVRLDSLIVEKNKTGPALRAEERFYPEMMGYLLRYILKGCKLDDYREVIVFTDSIPVGRKRDAVTKAVKHVLAEKLPVTARYRVIHHASKSNFDLQIADYCNWAIFRKWERGDPRSYDLVKTVLKSEFEIFQSGTTRYY